MTTYKEIFNMNMNEICDLATEGNWELNKLEVVSTFKSAQYLEMIANKE